VQASTRRRRENEIVAVSLPNLAPHHLLLVSTLAVALAAGCSPDGRGGVPAGPFECRAAESEAALIATGLVDPAATVDTAQAVALDPPVYAYTVVVAARVGAEVGTWAMGSHATGARVFALDDVARRVTTWGAAVDPGSPPDRQRQKVAARAEVEAARGCVADAGRQPPRRAASSPRGSRPPR
jgi:hypothetical protein